MPDHRGPSVVEHPLNDAGRLIFVAAIGLVHGADAFVGLHLRLDREIFHAAGLAVAIGERVAEDANRFEFAAAGMIVPDIINRPHVIFADHGANALDRRNGWSHAGFSVEAIGAAATSGIALLAVGLALGCVDLPIAGRNIFIRPGHLHAAVTRDTCFLSRG